MAYEDDDLNNELDEFSDEGETNLDDDSEVEETEETDSDDFK